LAARYRIPVTRDLGRRLCVPHFRADCPYQAGEHSVSVEQFSLKELGFTLAEIKCKIYAKHPKKVIKNKIFINLNKLDRSSNHHFITHPARFSKIITNCGTNSDNFCHSWRCRIPDFPLKSLCWIDRGIKYFNMD